MELLNEPKKFKIRIIKKNKIIDDNTNKNTNEIIDENKIIDENNNKIIDKIPKIKSKIIGRPKYIPTPEEIEEKNKQIEANKIFPKKTRRSSISEDDIKLYRKQYYQENRDKFVMDEVCELCAMRYCKSNRSRHVQSKRHTNNLLKNSIL